MAFSGLVAMSGLLWLVRHGATDWSDAGRLNGWTDVPLNERGRRQARGLRERLAGKEFSGIWTSDLGRATETGRLAVAGAVPDRRLRELDFGWLEGRRWEGCPVDVQQGLLEFDDFEAPGGESVAQLEGRLFDFIAALPEGDHLAFTHGGVIRLLIRKAGRDERVPLGGLVRVRW